METRKCPKCGIPAQKEDTEIFNLKAPCKRRKYCCPNCGMVVAVEMRHETENHWLPPDAST